MKKLAILLCVICGAIHLASADDSVIWEKWRKAYALFEQGDRLSCKKDFVGARKAYDEAYRLYQSIAKQDPNWNKTVVANRMELASRAIRDMERAGVASQRKDLPLPQDIRSCQAELTRARARIAELENETLRFRIAARSGQVSGADVEALLSEKKTILAEQASLRQKIAALERRIEELSGNRTATLEQQILQLNALLETQKARSAAAEDRVCSLEAALKKEDWEKNQALQRAAAAEQAKANAERATETATFMAKSRDAELNQLQRDLSAAQVRIHHLETDARRHSEETQTLQSRMARMQAGRSKEINAELVAENTELRNKITLLTRQNTQLSEEATVLDQHRILLQKENTARQHAQSQMAESLEKTAHQLKMTQEAYRKEQGAGKLGAAELQQLRTACRDLSARVARLTGENRDLSEQLKNRDRQERENLKELSRRLAEMEQIRTQYIAEAKALRDRCEKMISQIDQKTEELAALKRASSKDKREIAVLRQENRRIKTLEQELAEAQKIANQALKNEQDDAAQADKKLPAEAKEELKVLRRRVSELEKQRDELAILLQKQGVAVPKGKQAGEKSAATDTLQQSMLDAARRAEADGDVESAVWFYRELLKRDSRNPVYQEKIRVLSAPKK